MKKIIAMLLVLAMALSLVACGGSEKPAETQAPAAAAPAETEAAAPAKKYEGVELNYWSMWNEAEPQGQVILEAVAAFEAETGAKVNVEWKGRELSQVIMASLEAGEAIDLFDEDYQRIATTYAPYTADLTEMAAAAGYTGYDCLNNQVIAWAGNLNSIVEQPQVGGVFYDKDAFAAAGVSEPKTWEEFMAVCEQLKAAGIAPMSLDAAYADFMFYHALVAHMDEAAIEEAAKNGGWSATGAVQAAQETIDFVNAGYLVDGAPDEYPASQNKLGFGQSAMIVCANYVTAEVNNTCQVNLNWGLFGYPGCSAAYAGANSLAVTSYSENQQAAFDFIMTLTTGEIDQKMADTAAQIPCDPTNVAPAHLTGTIETLLAAEKPMTWCAGLNANSDLITNFKSMITDLYSGKYESGEDFCAALDALY